MFAILAIYSAYSVGLLKGCVKLIDDVVKTKATVRASFYLYTTKEDVDALINALNEGGDILDAYFN